MYGFPLTIYALTWLFGYQNPLTHISGHMHACMLSVIIILVGGLLIVVGWRNVYAAKGELATNGIYRYTRHPQYLGILLLTLGMIVQWVTLPTLLMWPILAILYYRLARQEEKEMEKKFGVHYREYKHKVPMFIPFPRN